MDSTCGAARPRCYSSGVFLALTVGCAQCHDHKFDPIPTWDYYAQLGVFRSTRLKEHPLASMETVVTCQRPAKRIEELQSQLDDFEQNQSRLIQT